ncbi:AI-2E family transporter [uncultured Cytophaga sp.]|uniref:AI-2E family transporter n=1 Tax=uncultured Cytophaga sp. TaxID=160238 RepID=UPI00260A347C|nr:AI-2E family transporter [uncultured Cytophaga sp.]
MTEKLPLYHKLSVILIGIVVFFYILFIGQEILVPLAFACLLAILLNPIVNFLQRKKVNKIVAIVLSIILMMLVAAGILYFIGSQASKFADMLPELKQKVNELAKEGLSWFSQTFNITTPKLTSWINEQKSKGMQGASGVVGATLGTVSGFFVGLFLLPVYIFLFLFYKPLLLQFIGKLFSSEKHKVVADVLNETKGLIQNYLIGLMIEMVIVAAMNSAALMIIGIKYAILLGVIGAILNLIPYIGGIIAIALPMIMGLMTDDPISALYVLIAYILIQFVDNNFLVPKIVASKVKVNAFISIIVVLIGGTLWGVAGMFLSIPLIAILKVIFDRVEALEPFGYLIGDDMPEEEERGSLKLHTKKENKENNKE